MAEFHGKTYSEKDDKARLTTQLDLVRLFMQDGKWSTLEEISAGCFGAPGASISARLRDLRKTEHGSYTVHRRHRGEAARGLYEYQLEKSGPVVNAAGQYGLQLPTGKK